MSVYIQTGFFGDEYGLEHPRIGYDRANGTVDASTEAAGFAGDNAATVRVDTAWRPTSLPGLLADWELNFDTPTLVSYFGIAAHDLGTQGAFIRIQATTDGGSTWTSIAGLNAIEPEDDSAILCLFDPVSVDGIRVRIESADDNPTIAVMATGEVMEWPRKAVWTGTPITEGDRLSFDNNLTGTGIVIGRTKESDGLEFSMQVDNLSEDWRTSTFKSFKAYANGEQAAFFIAQRALYYPDEVAYAWTTDTVRMSRETPNRRVSGSVTLNCIGYRQNLD